ncbi:MAG: hypothetical protein HY901_23355 [Deltaproteobacteria bacterium]|nr:hypothetical protein [Deltaproteobacteria bacterium]
MSSSVAHACSLGSWFLINSSAMARKAFTPEVSNPHASMRAGSLGALGARVAFDAQPRVTMRWITPMIEMRTGGSRRFKSFFMGLNMCQRNACCPWGFWCTSIRKPLRRPSPGKLVAGDRSNEADENVIESVALTYDFGEQPG